jgi:hypothetical protein
VRASIECRAQAFHRVCEGALHRWERRRSLSTASTAHTAHLRNPAMTVHSPCPLVVSTTVVCDRVAAPASGHVTTGRGGVTPSLSVSTTPTGCCPTPMHATTPVGQPTTHRAPASDALSIACMNALGGVGPARLPPQHRGRDRPHPRRPSGVTARRSTACDDVSPGTCSLGSSRARPLCNHPHTIPPD